MLHCAAMSTAFCHAHKLIHPCWHGSQTVFGCCSSRSCCPAPFAWTSVRRSARMRRHGQVQLPARVGGSAPGVGPAGVPGGVPGRQPGPGAGRAARGHRLPARLPAERRQRLLRRAGALLRPSNPNTLAQARGALRMATDYLLACQLNDANGSFVAQARCSDPQTLTPWPRREARCAWPPTTCSPASWAMPTAPSSRRQAV